MLLLVTDGVSDRAILTTDAGGEKMAIITEGEGARLQSGRNSPGGLYGDLRF